MIIDREERRKRKRREIVLARTVFTLIVITVAVVVVFGVNYFLKNLGTETPVVSGSEPEPVVVSNTYDTETESLVETETQEEETPQFVQVGDAQFVAGFTAYETDQTIDSTDEAVESEFFILIDESTGEIIAQRKGREKFYPASMTKILSILVAAEHIANDDNLSFDDEVTITSESTNFAYSNGLSSVGYLKDETASVTELFYGTILPSGGDAVHALALYTAGSHEAFVEMMNEKVEELGLSETSHFTNCAGLYDDENYSTPYDISMILKAAEENEFCREILKTRRYNIEASENHPEGIFLSNLFLRRIEDHYADGEVLGAKTGYVNESRNCCASYMLKNDGTPYICVTGKAPGAWNCVYDHCDIYELYTR